MQRRHKYIPALMAGLLLLSIGVEAPAYSSQDIAAFKAGAEAGDAYSQVELGIAYATGDGVSQDTTTAAYWFRKAAEQGHDEAAMYLADLHGTGNGVEKNFHEAARWYRQAARNGYAHAQFYLGKLIRLSLAPGTPQEARQWLEAAAAQGYEGAAEELALLDRDVAEFNASQYPPGCSQSQIDGALAEHQRNMSKYRSEVEEADRAFEVAYREYQKIPSYATTWNDQYMAFGAAHKAYTQKLSRAEATIKAIAANPPQCLPYKEAKSLNRESKSWDWDGNRHPRNRIEFYPCDWQTKKETLHASNPSSCYRFY